MHENKTINVLIVDDSAYIREIFSKLLSSDENINVVATASNPIEARQKIKQYSPDVITLDIEMPYMDGVSFLEKIMALKPMPGIMVSTLTQKGAQATLHCLEVGAVDYIAKPSKIDETDSLSSLKELLISKVKLAANANILNARSKDGEVNNVLPLLSNKGSKKIIAIGASTGGVEALKEILISLPVNMPPILITQHMPEKFTSAFAERLNNICAMSVQEATNQQPIVSGNVYIAPGNAHLRIHKSNGGFVCKVGGVEKISNHCPSVDVMFHSFANQVTNNAIGVILTGMGRDGASGLKEMRDAGAYTIGQTEKSCVVYGMPKVAFDAGAVMKNVCLSNIAKELVTHCNI